MAGAAQVEFDYYKDAQRAAELLHNTRFNSTTLHYISVVPQYDNVLDMRPVTPRPADWMPKSDDYDQYWWPEGRDVSELSQQQYGWEKFGWRVHDPILAEEDRTNRAEEGENRDKERARCRQKIREIMLKVERDREEWRRH